MRSSLLRILMALVVGLWSPLCCCQAALIAGVLTGAGTPVQQEVGDEGDSSAAEESGCCPRCRQAAAERTEPSNTPNQESSPDGTPCNDCPSCQGSVGLARLGGQGELTLKTIVSAMPVLLIAWPIEPVSSLIGTELRPLPRPPDYVAKNAGGRVILRWHCALIV